MYRVVTKYFDHRQNWVVDYGPWHVSRHDVENWAEILASVGYSAHVEALYGVVSSHDSDDDLRNALSSMA